MTKTTSRPRPRRPEPDRFAMLTDNDPAKRVPKFSAAQLHSPDFSRMRNLREVGSIITVDPRVLRSHPLNPRHVRSEEALDALAASMSAEGQLAAIQVWFEPGDTAAPGFILEGHTRRDAAVRLGWQEIRAEVVEPPTDDLAAYTAARALNVERQTHSPLDDTFGFRTLLDRGFAQGAADLALKLKIPRHLVTEALGIAELPKELLQLAAEYPVQALSRRHLVTLARYYKATASLGDSAHAATATRELMAQIVESQMSVRELEAIVSRAPKLAGRAGRPRTTAARVVTLAGRGELRVYPTGKLSLTLAGVKGEEADQVSAAILAALDRIGIEAG